MQLVHAQRYAASVSFRGATFVSLLEIFMLAAAV
jgi:hypothetical protein